MGDPHVCWQVSSYSTDNGACVEVGWLESSHCGNNGDCVEVGWRKSSHSTNNGDCVEVASGPAEVLIRDTKDRDGGTLSFPASGWAAFLRAVR